MKKLSVFVFILGIFFVSCSSEEPTPKEVPENDNQSASIEVTEAPVGSSAIDVPIINRPQSIPVDETITEEDLYDLVITLKTAIIRKDTSLLFRTMHPSVIISHGGGIFGYNGLVESWDYDWDGMWEQLDKITKMGGAYYNDKTYCFPYASAGKGDVGFTEEEHQLTDPYTTYICLKDSLLLYEKSSESSAVIAQMDKAFMSWSFETQPENGFVKVHTFDKKYEGFVREKDVFRTGSSSLVIKKGSDDKWIITSFAPFD